MLKRTLVPAAFLLLLAGCSAENKQQVVTSQEYGEDWPFTVESVELMCEPGPPKALLKVPDGTVYALNASASQLAKERGWSDAHTISKPSRWVKGTTMDYGNISQRAIALCPQP
ncbi:DUF2511 domain-containing protein [Pseudomonas sp. BIGb0427]|uniref:DUF2511 domain-containing protein n=1 Tax=Pseudomonas sp. BIGb0427 TaxID=2724470 RepID=UPI0018A7A130|nr:DUF2511 domain-containing protein [Pseudomonas sp. BIGb0427]QPG61226.1 DUF2511 domain-containing protein [Pseudomonas sp. BIGb0427]